MISFWWDRYKLHRPYCMILECWTISKLLICEHRKQGHNSKPREPADLLTTGVPVCFKMLPSLSNKQWVINKSLFEFFIKISIYTKIETRVSICMTSLCTLELGIICLLSIVDRSYVFYLLQQESGGGGGGGELATAFDLAAFGFLWT